MSQEKGQSRKHGWATPQESPKYVWHQGRLVPWEEATVHASMLGWSSISMVFEGIRGYWSPAEEQVYIFQLEEHVRRLFRSMKIMRMRCRWTPQEVSSTILELVRANELKGDLYVQPLAYFADTTPGYLPAAEKEGTMTVFARPAGSVLGTGRVVSCMVSSWGRISDNVMPPRAKAIANYQNSRYVGDEAALNGYDFGIILNGQGKVAEVTYACLYIIRDGVAITPPVTAGILESITRQVVKELLEGELGVPVVEREVDRTELYVADEAFLCGTGAEIQAIGSIDRYPVGDGDVGPVVSRLEALYHEVVRGRRPQYAGWLTPVY